LLAIGATWKGYVMSSDVSSIPVAPPKPAPVPRSHEPAVTATTTAHAEIKANVPQPVTPAEPKADPALMRQKLAEAIEHLNEMAQRNNYNLNFSVDDQSNQVVVRVRDSKSGDVIRQMPNEAALRMAHHLSDLKGLLSDEKI
jgi:flagellar protein FlaG